MGPDNAAIVRRMLEAYLRGDFETALSAFAEDVEWRDQFGTYHGHEGVAQSTARWTGTWEDLKMEIDELLEISDDDVGVILKQTARGRGSGVPVEGETGWIYTVRRGKIVRVRLVADPREAVKAAGLDP
jgi:ketosteroid isomerase-like protein